MTYYQDNEIKIRDILREDIVSLFSWRIDKELNKYDPRPTPVTSSELMEECIEVCPYTRRYLKRMREVV